MFSQFIAFLFLIYHVIVHFWMPIFRRFYTNDEITIEFMVTTIFDLMLPGVLIVIMGKKFELIN
jgi:hypothetical protein